MFRNVSKEELIIPASMEHLKEMRNFITYIGKKYRFTEKVINSFKLVIDEACTNVIRHGYQEIKDGKIILRAIIRRRSLTIVIVDQGKSFDPRQVANPDLEKYVRIGKRGGLGIFMMRKLMDDIQYNLTGQGNELRLTKMRDALPIPLLVWFETLSIRWKLFLISTICLIFATVGAFIFLADQIDRNIRKDVFSEAIAITKSFASTNWQPMNNDEFIYLNENAKSVQQSHPGIIFSALITTPVSEIIAIAPFERQKIGARFDLSQMGSIDSVNQVGIYYYSAHDTAVYLFRTPITLKEDEPIGYALIAVSRDYMSRQAFEEKVPMAIYLFLSLSVVVGSIAFLVTRITRSFHNLAEWVRQVGRGQVDQDEIDIDASDEVGEIAQAFNEMTTKFREAQASVIEQQRMRKELQVAQEIQQMLLPDDFPEVIGYDIASYYQSAKEVGGDLFDFVEVDEQCIGICVADVAGKGIPGSLVMTMIRTSLRLEARGNNNPADILTRVNSFVTDDMRRGMFVTMFYVILDSRERIVSFSSAGHNPMILYRGKSKKTFYLNPSGFPVGITLPDIQLFGNKIQADRICLHPDDVLVLYTDGVTEAMNRKRELYGEARFLGAIRKYGHLEVAEFVQNIKSDILSFSDGYEQNDDITLVAIKENMAAVDVKVETFKKLFEETRAPDGGKISEACQKAGISPATFYRYRRLYQEGGYELLREMLHGYTNLGSRHLSIEMKTLIYDVIREHPEFGPKKISDQLNTEKYRFTELSPLLIYEELKRAKLNTKERRRAFVHRGGKQRLKPPGTPLLTLSGEVLVGFRSEDQELPEHPFMASDVQENIRPREKLISSKGKKSENTEKKAPEKNDERKRKAQPDKEAIAGPKKKGARAKNDGKNKGRSVDSETGKKDPKK